ncbi:hypothetical protein G6F18_013193 [Rhizopus arrhizus]|nr:hypothetical protein G6F18_013193 [Rhizopus arrhizus]
MTVKHGGGNIMLWSAITYAGVGWMCKINGNMDKTLARKTSGDFPNDNDPKHTSKLVKKYLEQQSYNILEWPAQSPDLNPIENMWSLLKRRLNDYETAPKGMNELYERVTKVCFAGHCMSDRGIQFNPAPANARGSNSVGQPIAVPSRVVVPELASSDAIPDSFAYPRPGFPPMTHVQKRMREAEDMETDEVSLSFSIYMELRKENDGLKEMLRKEQEEKRALQ